MMRKIEMIGKKFHRLQCVQECGRDNQNIKLFEFHCECGNVVVTRGSSVRSGNTKSCGCLNKESSSAKNSKHGMYDTPEYRSWKMMKARCQRPSYSGFKNYGGRGIKVCTAWNSFDQFYRDMGVRPDGYTLDRIDVDGDYTPENCRWASRETQNRNMRRNINITCNGETHCAADWAKITGINAETITARYHRGWVAERILEISHAV